MYVSFIKVAPEARLKCGSKLRPTELKINDRSSSVNLFFYFQGLAQSSLIFSILILLSSGGFL